MSPDRPGERPARDPDGAQHRRRPTPYERDDDDWVGEPPEGRHSREQARPEAWHDWRAALAGVGLVVALLVLALVLLL